MITKPKIAYIIDDLSIGGAQKQLRLLIGVLPQEFSYIICCISEISKPLGEAIENEGGKVYYLHRKSHFDLKRLSELKRILRRENPQLVHSFLYASNAYAFLSARSLRIPVVLSLRSERLRMGKLRDFILANIFRRADAVTVNSHAGMKYLIEELHVDSGKVHLVGNCFVFPDSPKNAARNLKNRKTIGYVGRMPRKGKMLRNLISSFAILARDDPAVRLEFVGEGEARKGLETFAASLGLADRIVFHGLLTDPMPVMREFTCLVLPSAFEGFPNAVIEAMALGKPVVATCAGDIPRIVKPEITGRLLEDATASSLAKALKEVLEDETLHARAEKEGPRIVKTEFSPEKMLSSLIPLYESLIPVSAK